MSNVILTAIFIVLLTQAVVFVIFLSKLSMVFKELLLFITPADEGSPSPAAEVWRAMAATLVLQFKTTIMGLMSVQAKTEKRLEGEMATQAVSQSSPIIGAALNAFPALRKMFLKNPGLIDMAMSRIATGGETHQAGTDGGSNNDFASRLAKYA